MLQMQISEFELWSLSTQPLEAQEAKYCFQEDLPKQKKKSDQEVI